MPWFRRGVTGPSARRLGFNPRPVHMRFSVDPCDGFFFGYFGFPYQHHCTNTVPVFGIFALCGSGVCPRRFGQTCYLDLQNPNNSRDNIIAIPKGMILKPVFRKKYSPIEEMPNRVAYFPPTFHRIPRAKSGNRSLRRKKKIGDKR